MRADKKQDEIFEVDKVREDFPILGKRIYGRPLAYLDNAASAQKPLPVIDAMKNFYRENYANVHRGIHFLSNTATEAYENARSTMRRFLNASSNNSIIFTRNATEAINLVAYSWGMSNIGAGDEIVVTVMEHHSNLVPWHFIRERQGAKIVFVPVDAEGIFHIEDFAKALTKKTRLVAVTHMSNVLGSVLPVREIVKIAHAEDIPVLVDGAQGAVHLMIDVMELGCDWYVMTSHKLYGPGGIGVLYGKKKYLDAMHPFQGGGEMVEEVTQEKITYTSPPYRFEAGTPPIVEAIGFGIALNYIEKLGREKILEYERVLSSYAYERLSKIEGVYLLGRAMDRMNIFSFNLAGIHAYDVSKFVDRQGVAIRAGAHCAHPLLQHFGIDSCCRASLAFYNTHSDVDQLAAALIKARSFFK